MQFDPSSINGVQLKNGSNLAAEISQSAGSSSISIKSDVADLSLTGNYSVEQLAALGNYAARVVAREVARENIWEKSAPATVEADPMLKRPFTVSYRVAVKKSAPLALVLPIGNTRFRGTAEGLAVSKEKTCSITSSIALASLTTPESEGGLSIKSLEAQASLKYTSTGIAGVTVKGKALEVGSMGRNTGPGLFRRPVYPFLAQPLAGLCGG